MTQVLLIIQLLIAIAMVAVILLQRSEGGALGIGGGTMGGLMTTRGSANLLTRATGVLAACFMGMSLLLAILSSANRAPVSIIDQPPAQTAPAPESPPQGPMVPLGQ